MTATVDHPCGYPSAVLNLFDGLLPADALTLDPFAGIGGIHTLSTPTLFGTRRTVGVELEAEWARGHPGTIQGDATALPFDADVFDAVATSPAYGNRMADNFKPRDGSRHHTYRISLGRPLTSGSGAALQWGDKYRDLHRRAVAEMVRVCRPGGLVLVNVKDHIRDHEHRHVVDWWADTLADAGAMAVARHPVNSGGIPHGSNRTPMSEFVLEHRTVTS